MSELVAVLGAGVMGAQIGAEYSLGGAHVTLVTRSTVSASDAVRRAHAALDALAAYGLALPGAVAEAKSRIRGSADLAGSCAGSDLIVESLPEVLTVKAAALTLALAVAPNAIVASNTSSISILQLGNAIGAASRTIGTHYWNPPTLMPLVEVIPCSATERSISERMVARLRGLGKEPVVVADVKGFVWNRLQFALLREAVRLVHDNVADAATIDLIVRRGLARRLQLVGPFETVALGGPHTFAAIARELFPEIEAYVDPQAINDVALPAKESLVGLARSRDDALAALRRRELTPMADRPSPPGAESLH